MKDIDGGQVGLPNPLRRKPMVVVISHTATLFLAAESAAALCGGRRSGGESPLVAVCLEQMFLVPKGCVTMSVKRQLVIKSNKKVNKCLKIMTTIRKMIKIVTKEWQRSSTGHKCPVIVEAYLAEVLSIGAQVYIPSFFAFSLTLKPRRRDIGSHVLQVLLKL